LLIYIVPLALAAPAAAAGLAYLNAKTNIGYDYRLLGSILKGRIKNALREKKDQLSQFYMLEYYALGKQANTVFLIFEGRQWTYKETYDIVLKYGTWLKTKYSIKPKEVVVMDFTNSEQFVFVWLGLWAIGAKPAFINYNLTGKALEHCVKVSTGRLALIDPQIQELVTQDVRDALPSVQFDIFSPELEAEAMSTQAVREPDSSRTEEKTQNMAALIYTSGTTGLPKPAVVSWGKVNVGAYIVEGWSSFGRPDILYTVSYLNHCRSGY